MKNLLPFFLFFLLLAANAQAQSSKSVQKWVDKEDWASIAKKATSPTMAAIVVSIKSIQDEVPTTISYSLLEYAILKKQNDLVKQLLVAGDPNASGSDKFNPLLLAVMTNNAETLKLLLDKGADIHKQGDEGFTAIAWAAKSGNTALVQLLLDKGANIDDHNIHGETPLMLAVNGTALEVVRLLLEKKADINTKDRDGNTAISLAAIAGNKEMVELLLAKNANYTQLNSNSESPSMIATKLGHIGVLRLFIEKGLTNNNLATLATLAIQNKQINSLKVLIERGLNLSPTDENGVLLPLIEEAIKAKDTLVLELFLDNNANAQYKNALLILAVRKSKIDLIEMFLKRGASVNAKNKDSLSAVLVAAQAGSVPAVRLLLKYGADPNCKTTDGKFLRDVFNDKKIYLELDANPRFPGCEKEEGEVAKKNCSEKKLLDFVQGHLQYPTVAKEKATEGIALISFAVMEDGSLSSIEITKDPGDGLGAEAARVVGLMNTMPEKWVPAMQLGRAVKVRYSLPVSFKAR